LASERLKEINKKEKILRVMGRFLKAAGLAKAPEAPKVEPAPEPVIEKKVEEPKKVVELSKYKKKEKKS